MHEYCNTLVSASCSTGPDIMNLLINKKVDLVLQAHDHAFNRSKQLALRTGCSLVNPGPYDGDCVVDTGSDGIYGRGAGTVIMTVGVGGKSINSVDTHDSEAPYFIRWMGSNANPTYGFLKISVSSTSLSGRFIRGAVEELSRTRSPYSSRRTGRVMGAWPPLTPALGRPEVRRRSLSAYAQRPVRTCFPRLLR